MVNKIYILQSLPISERQTGKELYDDVIVRYTQYHESLIKTSYLSVTGKSDFIEKINSIIQETNENDEIILHIEAHGGNEVLQFANNELLKWIELERYLVQLNLACKNKLHLNLATCHGMHIAEKISLKATAPYKSFISALRTLNPEEIIGDNSIFYEEIIKNGNIFISFVNFLNIKRDTQLKIKDVKTVLDYILSYQIMRFQVMAPNFDLKIFYDSFLNINLDKNQLQLFNNSEEKIRYILNLFYERYFPE